MFFSHMRLFPITLWNPTDLNGISHTCKGWWDNSSIKPRARRKVSYFISWTAEEQSLQESKSNSCHSTSRMKKERFSFYWLLSPGWGASSCDPVGWGISREQLLSPSTLEILSPAAAVLISWRSTGHDWQAPAEETRSFGLVAGFREKVTPRGKHLKQN